MISIELQKVCKNVILLAGLLAGLSALILQRFELKSPYSSIFLFLGFVFMVTHWWLLASFIGQLARLNRFELIFQGLLLFLPASLALSLVFIAGKLDPQLLVPAGLGIVTVPFAATLYGLVMGLTQCLPVFQRKERNQ